MKKTVAISIALAFVGFALYDYQKSDEREAAKQAQNKVLPEVYSGDLNQIRIQRPMGELLLERKEGSGWFIQAPFQDRAGYEEIESYFSMLSNEELIPVEVSSPVAWAQYGLETPETQFEIQYKGSNQLKLSLGSVRTVDDGFYIKKNDEEKLYRGSNQWLGLSLKIADELRDKTVINSFKEPEKIQLSAKKEKINWSIEKKEGEWSAGAGTHLKHKLEEATIDQYIHLLRHLKAERVSELNQKLKSPVLQIYMGSKNSEPLTLSFYEDEKKIYALVSNRQVTFEISRDTFNSIVKPIDYFYDKSLPFQFNVSAVKKIEIQLLNDKAPQRWTTINNQWVYDTESPHELADPVKIESFLNAIKGLRAADFVIMPNDTSLKENKILLKNEDFKTVFSLQWGGSTTNADGDFYFAQSQTSQVPFLISKTMLDDLLKSGLNKSPDDKNN